jgi:hypothetical protein
VQINRTIPSNKSDVINRENEKGAFRLKDVDISGDRNVNKKEAEKILNFEDLNNRNTPHVDCKNKNDTDNNRGN